MPIAPGTGELEREAIRLALREDAAQEDVTAAALVPPEAVGTASIVARAAGVASGAEAAALVFEEVASGNGRVAARVTARSGTRVAAGRELLRVEGPLRLLLAGERTAVNLVQRMSGIATLTARFVEAVAGTRARILATRKTAPGLRAFDVAAVRAGGGDVHRVSLADRVLVKKNHLDAARAAGTIGTIADAMRRLAATRVPIGVEVTDLDGLRAVLGAGAEVVLLDNFTPELCARAVALRDAEFAGRPGAPSLEASGGITLENVRRYAESGVERISVGALTHSAPALDVSMKILAG
jgi:nicotinate-nucleotide pyrophosphorylase (carboxylating)